jgi:hypothetical protein
MEAVLNKNDIVRVRRHLLRLKLYRGLLVSWQFIPIAIGVVYFIEQRWSLASMILFILSVALNVYLYRKTKALARRIRVLEMTLICYRIEKGERFSPDHKDYLLYQETVFTLRESN